MIIIIIKILLFTYRCSLALVSQLNINTYIFNVVPYVVKYTMYVRSYSSYNSA